MQTKNSTIDTNKGVSVLEKYIQVVPSELLECLKESARENGISLDIEIAARLTVYMAEPGLAKDNSLVQKILNREFTHQEAVEECKRKREAALYVYEMEKLRLFLRFEKAIPRRIKENFTVIDVKEATKKIKAELEAEDKQNQTNEGDIK